MYTACADRWLICTIKICANLYVHNGLLGEQVPMDALAGAGMPDAGAEVAEKKNKRAMSSKLIIKTLTNTTNIITFFL